MKNVRLEFVVATITGTKPEVALLHGLSNCLCTVPLGSQDNRDQYSD